MENKVITIELSNGGKAWYYQSEWEAQKKYFRNRDIYLAFFWKSSDTIKRLKRAKEKCIFAYCLIGNTRKLIYYNEEKNIAYKVDKDMSNTFMKWSKFRFDRFCSLMDL